MVTISILAGLSGTFAGAEYVRAASPGTFAGAEYVRAASPGTFAGAEYVHAVPENAGDGIWCIVNPGVI